MAPLRSIAFKSCIFPFRHFFEKNYFRLRRDDMTPKWMKMKERWTIFFSDVVRHSVRPPHPLLLSGGGSQGLRHSSCSLYIFVTGSCPPIRQPMNSSHLVLHSDPLRVWNVSAFFIQLFWKASPRAGLFIIKKYIIFQFIISFASLFCAPCRGAAIGGPAGAPPAQPRPGARVAALPAPEEPKPDLSTPGWRARWKLNGKLNVRENEN